MAKKERTQRGFRIFGEFENSRGELKIVESSLAFEGPHARIYLGNDEHLQCDVQAAKDIILALTAFIKEAEANELTEPMENYNEH